MRDEHKIIMSTYYKVPNTDPTGLDEQDYEYTVSMDAEQMLFWMKGVFGKVEYKYHIGDMRTNIVPEKEKEEEYHKLIDHSNEVFEQNGILAIYKDDVKGFSSDDYLKISEYETSGVKERLYFLNVLTNHFNSTGRLGERENVIHHCLFDYQNGKEFIGYLLAMLTRLLVAYRDEGSKEVRRVIDRLDNDLTSMQQCYAIAEKVLILLRNCDTMIQYNYQKNFFISSSDKLIDWITKHQRVTKQGDIWEFIFEGECSKNYRDLAVNLLWHIVQISQFILKNKHRTIKWEDKLKSKVDMTEFYYLDDLVKQLEQSNKNSSFDRITWANEYIQKLGAVAREMSFSVVG